MAHDPHPSHDEPASERGAVSAGLLWVLLSLVIVTAITLVAIQAPPRVKLIGLFAVGYGLLTGWLIALAAGPTRFVPGRPGVAVTFVLITLGQCGLALESHRLHRAAEFRTFEKSPQSRLPQAERLRHLLHEATRFSVYQRHRLSALGQWPSPWPMLFWTGEVLLAGALGTWLACRLWSRGP